MTGRDGRVGSRRPGRVVVGVVAIVALAALATVAPARAQGVDPGATVANNPFYAAPGNYGTSWGMASYGLKRTYSEFSSPFGPGYATGYAPSGFLPGRFGVGLWRPGFNEAGVHYGGRESYRTFPVPYVPGRVAVTPPMGVYAPAFGPSYLGW